MMSIAFKEGIKNLAPALNEIILAANQDVRQVKTCRDITMSQMLPSLTGLPSLVAVLRCCTTSACGRPKTS